MTASGIPKETLAAAGRLLGRRLGLRFNPSIAGRLSRSLAEEAAALDLEIATYTRRIEDEPTLLQGLVDRVTVQETSFFRDPGQLQAFRTHVLPHLGPTVRIWSAACSNGQEPYTLAMILADSGVADWRVMATDVSTRAVERTRRARYSTKEVAGVPPHLRARYLRPSGADCEVVGALRERVSVRCHNLADSPPFKPGEFGVVFCRNVLIYLEDEAISALIDRLARWLGPPGWLFLGYSESLWQVTDAFALARLGSAFAYRLRDSTASAASALPSAASASPGSARRTPARPARRGNAESAPVLGGAPARSLVADGEAAMNAGDHAAAIVAFRKVAYLEPEEPFSHLHLGLALEASGDVAAARRAFAVARTVLARGDNLTVEASLKGYGVDDLLRLLDRKLAER